MSVVSRIRAQALLKKASHVPFRDSKLTHMLSDSLGGDSKCADAPPGAGWVP